LLFGEHDEEWDAIEPPPVKPKARPKVAKVKPPKEPPAEPGIGVTGDLFCEVGSYPLTGTGDFAAQYAEVTCALLSVLGLHRD